MSAHRIAPDDDSACGTNRGFARHRTRREPACDRCHDAHLTYQRAWYDANKDRLAKIRRKRAEARWKLAA